MSKPRVDLTPELLTALKNFREWWANHFEDFDTESNKELLCLDNEAAALIVKAEASP